MGKQARAGQALVDRLGELVGDHDVRFAGVLGADVLEHDQGRGPKFELLADLMADTSPLGAAVGAGAPFGQHVVQDRLAGQARRQRLATVAILLGGTRRLHRPVIQVPSNGINKRDAAVPRGPPTISTNDALINAKDRIFLLHSRRKMPTDELEINIDVCRA